MLQPPASIQFIHYQDEIKTLANLHWRILESTCIPRACPLPPHKRDSFSSYPHRCNDHRHPRAATANGTIHWFNDITQCTPSCDCSIHLPSSYGATKVYPPVLGFHGLSSVGVFFEADTGLSGSKYSAEKILLYPNAVGGAWAGANCSELTVPEDLQFVSDLLEDICVGVLKTVVSTPLGARPSSSHASFSWPLPTYPPFLPPASLHISARLFLNLDFELRRAEHTIPGLPSAAASVTPSPALPSAANRPPSPAACAPSSFYTNYGGVSGQVVNSRTSQPCMPAHSPLPVLKLDGGSDTDMPYAGGAEESGTEPGIVSPLLALYLGELSRGATHNGCTGGNTTETLFSGEVDDMRERSSSSFRVEFLPSSFPAPSSFYHTILGENPTFIDLSPPIRCSLAHRVHARRVGGD
ncbi:hypothetical protein DFH08DRAFT_1026022 [Mycena albidolilacea]|uniref:Uncharacterized protein n=1 Tax=Mycena albidolilacea TaxID=1033008 RepID=A0AAD6ZM54_9AGAR|nr:hypothetical protein DFH08DRAFT_1026022 [Mycena albidolilacea]